MPIKANMIQADDAIKDIHEDIKACYLQEEKPLRYFKHTSYLNCIMECTSNYTQKVMFQLSLKIATFHAKNVVSEV